MTTNEQAFKNSIEALTSAVLALAKSHQEIYGDPLSASPVPQAGPSLPTNATKESLAHVLSLLNESKQALTLLQ
jgi:hypothetical protein